MKTYKRILLALFILGNMFISTSCWDYVDVERHAIVVGFAIDKDTRTNDYILTVEIARPEAGQNTAKYMSDIYESTGSTIFEAVRNLIEIVGKKTYWAHASIGILSKAVVSEDITPILDFLYRDPEPRPDIYILISKKETAKEIFETAHNPDDLMTSKLEYIIENQDNISKYPKTYIKDLTENLESEEKAIIIPLIDIKKVDDKISPEVNGSAVLRYDKVVGYLTGEETQYALWIMGELKGGLLVVQNIAKSNNNISFEIIRNKTKVDTEYTNDEPRMKVHIVTTVDIGEVSGNINFQKEEEKEKLREEAEKVMKSKLEYIVKKMKTEYKSDIFDFGNKISINNKSIWKKLKPKWNEDFGSLPVDIKVDLMIKGSAMITMPLKGEK